MGYYEKSTNYYSETYKLNSNLVEELPTIVIINNESIRFDFSDYKMDSQYDKIKIKIDFGDGKKNLLIKPLNSRGGTWDIIEHFYSIDDKETIETGNKITIEIKNIEGLTDNIVIPFEILKSESTSYNVALELLNANLTNDNKISFIFNNIQDNQVILASTK